MLKMIITLDGQTELPASVETIWVKALRNGNYSVQNVPIWAYNSNLDDEVCGKVAADSRLHFEHVVRPSGNVAYQIIALDGVDPKSWV